MGGDDLRTERHDRWRNAVLGGEPHRGCAVRNGIGWRSWRRDNLSRSVAELWPALHPQVLLAPPPADSSPNHDQKPVRTFILSGEGRFHDRLVGFLRCS